MSDLIERIETHGHCNARDGCIACDLLKEARVALEQAQATIDRHVKRLQLEQGRVCDLSEQVAALESKEVCTAPHDDQIIEGCPYCRIETFQAQLKSIFNLALDALSSAGSGPEFEALNAIYWLARGDARSQSAKGSNPAPERLGENND